MLASCAPKVDRDPMAVHWAMGNQVVAEGVCFEAGDLRQAGGRGIRARSRIIRVSGSSRPWAPFQQIWNVIPARLCAVRRGCKAGCKGGAHRPAAGTCVAIASRVCTAGGHCWGARQATKLIWHSHLVPRSSSLLCNTGGAGRGPLQADGLRMCQWSACRAP